MTTLAPYLTVVDAPAALAFYEAAFGATETGPRLSAPDGTILHTEVALGDAVFMLAEHMADFGTHEPKSLGGTPVRMSLEVDDADAFVARAVEAGATVVIPVDDQFYGHRAGRIQDPFGHLWIVGHEVEKLTAAEMQARMDAAFKDG